MIPTGSNPLIPRSEMRQNYFAQLPADLKGDVFSYLDDKTLYNLTNTPMPDDSRKVLTKALRTSRAQDILAPLSDEDFTNLRTEVSRRIHPINNPNRYNQYLTNLTEEQRRMHNYEIKKDKARLKRYENFYDNLSKQMILQPSQPWEFPAAPYNMKKAFAKMSRNNLEHAQDRLNHKQIFLEKIFGIH